MEENDGDYGFFEKVYQEYVELPTDENEMSYQAGVFYASEEAQKSPMTQPS